MQERKLPFRGPDGWRPSFAVASPGTCFLGTETSNARWLHFPPVLCFPFAQKLERGHFHKESVYWGIWGSESELVESFLQPRDSVCARCWQIQRQRNTETMDVTGRRWGRHRSESGRGHPGGPSPGRMCAPGSGFVTFMVTFQRYSVTGDGVKYWKNENLEH